jgi:cytochrome c553
MSDRPIVEAAVQVGLAISLAQGAHMRRGYVPFFLAVMVSVVALCAQIACSQAPPPPQPKPASDATVLQVMRGIVYPASNVVFAAQSDDPEQVEKAADPSTATDPLKSTYGGWEAVTNAGYALSEATTLLELPRSCSDGKPAPIDQDTWKQGITQLRAAGAAAVAAGKAKNQDQVLDAADKIVTACATCHDKYREPTPRCTP